MTRDMTIKKAERLEDMIRNFKLQSLDERDFEEFYYNGTMKIRMGNNNNPMRRLFKDCTMQIGINNAYLLAGHRGCGKSTELFDLKQKFVKEYYPVAMVRAEIDLNLHLADCWDIMLFVTKALCEIADENNINLPDATVEAVLDYIKTDIVETETIDKDATIRGEASATASVNLAYLLKVFLKIKSSLQVGTHTRTILTRKGEQRASEWVMYIKEISDIIANKMDGKQPIIIFEGLDKIQPYDRAFDVFRHEILAKMPFPVIYSFPMPLIYDSKIATLESLYSISVLPMIKISNVDKTDNNEGIDVITQIVEKRASLELFDHNVLTHMIKQTGGVLRHLFECIVTASYLASWREAEKIEMQDAEDALSEIYISLTRLISTQDNEYLIKIYNDENYRKSIDNKDDLLNLIGASVILEYRNGDRWHDLHPLISKFLENQGVVNEKNN